MEQRDKKKLGHGVALQSPLQPGTKASLCVITRHGAYIFLLLEKREVRPKIYIGSGIHAKYGVSARLSHYGKFVLVPIVLAKA